LQKQIKKKPKRAGKELLPVPAAGVKKILLRSKKENKTLQWVIFRKYWAPGRETCSFYKRERTR
jgi:hypothetical protein